MTSPESGFPKPKEQIPSPPGSGIEKMEFDVGEATEKNENDPERKNEDAYFCLRRKNAFAVFDGMGGHAAGEIASQIARDDCQRKFEESPRALSETEMMKMISDASDHIYTEAKKDPDLRGMGTTASVVQIVKTHEGKKKAMIANVGDSRVYIQRASGALEQATIDDSWMKSVLESTGRGKEVRKFQLKLSNAASNEELSEEEQKFWKYRNWIVNALGGEVCEPKIYSVDINEGDTIIITSDGIHDILTDEEISEIVKGSGDAQSKAMRLVQASVEKNRQKGFRHKERGDDKTALVIKPL